MSENLQPQSSDEVDLGQLFKLIGNAFNRLFKLIGNVFNSLFLAFVWLVFFVKKHFIKLIIAAIIGVVYGFIKEKLSDPIYSASIVIKQNYNTGENLNSIKNRYNNLIIAQDSMILAKDLKISPEEASQLSGFYLEPVLSENEKLKSYDIYKKDIDSVIASKIDFKTFLENGNEYDFKILRITVNSKSRIDFNNILNQLVKNTESTGFFVNEQKKDLNQLSRRENAIRESLKESDSLQKVYQLVLERSVENVPGSQTSVTIDNTEDKSVTKEFELFNQDVELRRELVEIARQKENLEHIIEVMTNDQAEGTLLKGKDVFGKKIGIMTFYGVILLTLLFMLLLGLEFLKFLERYKGKV